MESGKFEQKSINYEHAHVLAEAFIEDISKKYDLQTGHIKEEGLGKNYDTSMDFWMHWIYGQNDGKKPQTKTELIEIFEVIINEIYKSFVLEHHKDGINNMNKVYKNFVLNQPEEHPIYLKAFKHSIEQKLRKKFYPSGGDSSDYFPGFHNNENNGEVI